MKKIQIKSLIFLTAIALSTTPSNGMENAAKIATGLATAKKISLATIAVAATVATIYAAWYWLKETTVQKTIHTRDAAVEEEEDTTEESEPTSVPTQKIRRGKIVRLLNQSEEFHKAALESSKNLQQ